MTTRYHESRWFILAALLMIVVARVTQAQQPLDDLGADRPGIGVGSAVLPPGVLQLESGLSLGGQRNGTSTIRVLVAGSPLIRAGLIKGLELRFDGDGFRSETSTDRAGVRRTVRGASGFEAGAKVAVVHEGKLRPEIAALPAVSLPVGSNALTGSAVDPSFTLAWSKVLPRSLSLGGNLLLASAKDSQGRFLHGAESFVVGFPLAWKLSGYAELYRLSSPVRDASASQTFDGGLNLLMVRRVQLDLEGGHTVFGDKASWFVGVGIVYRARD